LAGTNQLPALVVLQLHAAPHATSAGDACASSKPQHARDTVPRVAAALTFALSQ